MAQVDGRTYTVFGLTVLELAHSRGIMRQEDLAEALTNTSGETYKQQRLSRYFNGDRPAYKRLPVHLCLTLKLNKSEQRRLADAFAYGQESYPEATELAS